jgi:hypothetical protein
LTQVQAEKEAQRVAERLGKVSMAWVLFATRC